jgi:hypothetical protein
MLLSLVPRRGGLAGYAYKRSDVPKSGNGKLITDIYPVNSPNRYRPDTIDSRAYEINTAWAKEVDDRGRPIVLNTGVVPPGGVVAELLRHAADPVIRLDAHLPLSRLTFFDDDFREQGGAVLGAARQCHQ